MGNLSKTWNFGLKKVPSLGQTGCSYFLDINHRELRGTEYQRTKSLFVGHPEVSDKVEFLFEALLMQSMPLVRKGAC